MEQGSGDGDLLFLQNVRIQGHDAPRAGIDADVAAEEELARLERLLIDAVIDEGAAAVDAAGQREAKKRALQVAAIVKDEVDRAVHGIDRHPGKTLSLAVALRIIVDAQGLA